MRHILSLSLLLLAGSVSALAGSAAIDSGLLALVPPGSKIVSAIDLDAARNSEFGHYILSKMQAEDHNFEQFAQQTGFDPRVDLQYVVFSSPGANGDQMGSKFAILARGNFDPQRIASTAKAKGAVAQTYQGVDILVHASGTQKTGVAFPEPSIAVMGDIATLEQIIAGRLAPTALDPALQQQISKVQDSDAWFVSLMPGSFLANQIKEQTKQPMQRAQVLQSVLQSSGAIRFGDQIQLSFDALTRSPKDATSLADVVRFVASMVQMQRQNDPRADVLATALDNMNLTTDGDAMHLSIAVPEKSLEQLAELSPKGIVAPHHQAK